MKKTPRHTDVENALECQQLILTAYNQGVNEFSLNGIIQGIIGARMSLEDKLAKILANKHLPNHLKATWVKKLVESGADVATRNHVTLRWAAEHGDLELVTMAVERGSDIHCLKDEPLSRASLQGHAHVVKYLLDHGATLDVKEHVALRLSASCGHLDVVDLLLAHGADVTAKHNEPLRKAFDGGHMDIVACLLSKKGHLILDSAEAEEDWQIFAIAWKYAKAEDDEHILNMLTQYDYRPVMKRSLGCPA